MIERSLIGHTLTPHSVEVEKGRLRFFAKVTGQKNSVYTDEDMAKSAGYRSLPVPPTFLFCLGFDAPNPFEIFQVLKVDIGKILHGEQSFTYFKEACAGDVLTFKPRISDIQVKKNATLEVVYHDTSVENQDGELVANLRSVIIVKQ